MIPAELTREQVEEELIDLFLDLTPLLDRPQNHMVRRAYVWLARAAGSGDIDLMMQTLDLVRSALKPDELGLPDLAIAGKCGQFH